jgi:hypothetical protein
MPCHAEQQVAAACPTSARRRCSAGARAPDSLRPRCGRRASRGI